MFVWLLLLLTMQAPPERTSTVPAGYTRLVGDDIPAWSVWRTVFRALATQDAIAAALALEPDQRQLIVTAAKRAHAADEANRARQQQTLDDLKAQGKDYRKAIKPALYEIDYEQRVRTLSERDELLVKLTPEARMVLEATAHSFRQGAERYVRTEDLQKFNRP